MTELIYHAYDFLSQKIGFPCTNIASNSAIANNDEKSSTGPDIPKIDIVDQPLLLDDQMKKNFKTILIIGRSRNGKTSIGNSILKEKKFETSASSDIELIYKDFSCNGFKVFDLSGVADSPEDFQVSDDEVCDQIRKILETSEIDAFLFVLKYGVRYTKQEKDAVTRVKLFFGDNVFKDHVILAFSYGDLFDQDKCIEEDTFEDWCRQQTGDIQLLFEEVSYRCVLFNNKSQTNNFDETFLKDCLGCKETEDENQSKNNSRTEFKKNATIDRKTLQEAKPGERCNECGVAKRRKIIPVIDKYTLDTFKELPKLNMKNLQPFDVARIAFIGKIYSFLCKPLALWTMPNNQEEKENSSGNLKDEKEKQPLDHTAEKLEIKEASDDEIGLDFVKVEEQDKHH